MDNSDSFEDPTVRNPFHGQVSVLEDYEEPGDWRVEYFDSDGGCYVTIFAGPESEKRARDYFNALKGRWLKIIRATDVELGIID